MVEFISTLDQTAIETIAAFANAKGGHVFIGITDSGKISDGQFGNETIQQWLNQIRTNTFPAIMPDIETAAFEHKNIVAFIVDEFPLKHVSCRGKYLKRISNSNHQIPLHEIADLHLRSFQQSLYR